MASTVKFSLCNNQMSDVNVNVYDMRTGNQVLNTNPLNRDECVDVEVVADSSGKGAARWDFWSSDGSVNSNKQQSDIGDGDRCSLG